MTKLALALDVPSIHEATELVVLTKHVDVYKIGLQLYTRFGPAIVERIKDMAPNAEIFLDLKLHDIPNTMAGAVRSAVALDVDYLTVHAVAGGEALKACAKEAEGTKLKLAAISVLTSLMPDSFIRRSHVVERARLACRSGIPCLVCAVADLEELNRTADINPFLITPGIRMPGGDAHDQKHVATPSHAREQGSNMIVVGRAIRNADDPGKAAAEIKAML